VPIGIGINRLLSGFSTMTKRHLVMQIAQETGLTQAQALEVVQRTFNEIIQTLVTEGRIELRNFGVFEVERRAARRARNPHTGEKIIAPARNVVTFKPGREMKELVRNLNSDGKAD
jgi:nucleoid DNA-binding protein